VKSITSTDGIHDGQTSFRKSEAIGRRRSMLCPDWRRSQGGSQLLTRSGW